jgi:threonine dehydratase
MSDIVQDINSRSLIEQTLFQIKPYINNTQIISSSTLNEFLGHEIYFKLESLQKTGSFKIRGVLNSLLNLQNKNKMPSKVTTYSTGNHSIALAWATAKFFNVETEIYLPRFTSDIKQSLAQAYNAKIILTETRAEAESRALEAAKQDGCFLLPPSDHDDIIAGASTVSYETLNEMREIDAIFVPIGGGGLASGTLITKQLFSPNTKVYAGEPKVANDASISYQTGKIFRFKNSPETIADGAKTLGLSDKVFKYIKQLDGIYEISEREILYWTNWFTHLTKISCEPTSALAIAAAYRFLQNKTDKQRIAVVISGGNLEQDTCQQIWAKNYLEISPEQFNCEEE